MRTASASSYDAKRIRESALRITFKMQLERSTTKYGESVQHGCFTPKVLHPPQRMLPNEVRGARRRRALRALDATTALAVAEASAVGDSDSGAESEDDDALLSFAQGAPASGRTGGGTYAVLAAFSFEGGAFAFRFSRCEGGAFAFRFPRCEGEIIFNWVYE